jgi:hypothetical protein
MLLFHGSNQEITTIDLSRCKPYKDFGRGFYLTTIKEQAELMARRTVRIFGGVSVVTSFMYDEISVSKGELSVKAFSNPNAEWAMFVLNNRNRDFRTDTDSNNNHDNKYDIVTGPVANDDIALLFRTFASGYIDLEALIKGMKYKRLNDQYSFHTERAVALLSKEGVFFCE